MSENVHHLPERESLPAEFAAIRFPSDEDGNGGRIVINAKEDRARDTLRFLKPHVFIPILLEPIIRWAKRHPGQAVIAAAAASAVVSVAVTMTIIKADHKQQPTAQRVVTVPPQPAITMSASTPTATRTARPTRTPRASRPPVSVATSTPSTPSTRPAERTSRPRASRDPSPDEQPPAVADSPTPQEQPPSSDEPRPEPTGRPQPSNPPPAEEEPSIVETPSQSPPPAQGSDCDGLINVELDPLLSLCLLG